MSADREARGLREILCGTLPSCAARPAGTLLRSTALMPTQERGTLRIGFPHQPPKETGKSALRIMAFAVTARVSSGPNFTHGWSLTKGFALGRPLPRYNNWPKGSRDQGRHAAPAAKTFYETHISSGAWGLWGKAMANVRSNLYVLVLSYSRPSLLSWGVCGSQDPSTKVNCAAVGKI